LHGHRSSSEAVGVDAALAGVDRDGEGVPQSNGSEEHLDADQKVLEEEKFLITGSRLMKYRRKTRSL
jgi:hypothetical protein